MASTSDKYSVLYDICCEIFTSNGLQQYVSSSDIVSVSIIHNYDKAMYPIIRIRLYTDISTLEKITDDPDNINIGLAFNGGVYNMNYKNDDGNGNVQIVDGAYRGVFTLKGYIENKNTPTSIMDQYEHGIKKGSDLNTNNKVPITLYGYNDGMIHALKQKAPAIYKNMDITSIIGDLTESGYYTLSMDDILNQQSYPQVLLPNISVKESLTFFERKYGLYPKGALIYGEGDILYIVDTDVEKGGTAIPIYVESYKNASDMTGLKKYSSSVPKYMFNTKAANVSVITESDIERVLNSPNIGDVNVNDWEIHSTELTKIYNGLETDIIKRIDPIKRIKKLVKIETPDILHKSNSPYISSTRAARVTERVTRIDLSGVGFDVFAINPRSRFNLIFESPIRGMSINDRYRISSTVHTFTNLSSKYFIAQTTMQLCSN